MSLPADLRLMQGADCELGEARGGIRQLCHEGLQHAAHPKVHVPVGARLRYSCQVHRQTVAGQRAVRPYDGSHKLEVR